jgi:hypothetical protein
MSDPTRYQLRIGGAANEHIQEMCSKLRAQPKDVILEALAILYFAVEATEQGRQVGSYDPRTQNFTAVATPSLQRLAKNARENLQSAR